MSDTMKSYDIITDEAIAYLVAVVNLDRAKSSADINAITKAQNVLNALNAVDFDVARVPHTSIQGDAKA